MAAEQELPLFLGLTDKSITDIPKTVEKQRYMTSVAPKAANPGKWIEQPRLPIPTGEHAVIECAGKIHVIAGYAKHRVDQNFHQVYDPATKVWSMKAVFPHPCNHVAGVSIGTKLYTFGGFVEQNRCPHSKCFVYDTATDQWAPIAGLSRPRGAISAIVLDGKIHLLGGRDVRSVEWHEVYDPATDKYS
ncbi:MAG: kelch repeat-containing protein, partial [Xanthobacteraceae bacterium]